MSVSCACAGDRFFICPQALLLDLSVTHIIDIDSVFESAYKQCPHLRSPFGQPLQSSLTDTPRDTCPLREKFCCLLASQRIDGNHAAPQPVLLADARHARQHLSLSTITQQHSRCQMVQRWESNGRRAQHQQRLASDRRRHTASTVLSVRFLLYPFHGFPLTTTRVKPSSPKPLEFETGQSRVPPYKSSQTKPIAPTSAAGKTSAMILYRSRTSRKQEHYPLA